MFILVDSLLAQFYRRFGIVLRKPQEEVAVIGRGFSVFLSLPHGTIPTRARIDEPAIATSNGYSVGPLLLR
jgi:hypothetical protein